MNAARKSINTDVGSHNLFRIAVLSRKIQGRRNLRDDVPFHVRSPTNIPRFKLSKYVHTIVHTYVHPHIHNCPRGRINISNHRPGHQLNNHGPVCRYVGSRTANAMRAVSQSVSQSVSGGSILQYRSCVGRDSVPSQSGGPGSTGGTDRERGEHLGTFSNDLEG